MDIDQAGEEGGSGVTFLLTRAIEGLRNGHEQVRISEARPVQAEWTGFRSGVKSDTPRPEASEEEQYNMLMEEVSSDVTVLYFHGGAY